MAVIGLKAEGKGEASHREVWPHKLEPTVGPESPFWGIIYTVRSTSGI